MPLKNETPFSGAKLNVSSAAMKAAAEEIRPERLVRALDRSPSPAEMAALMTPRDGIVIQAGGPGSGKTTTLYALIRAAEENRPERLVRTLDRIPSPAEMGIPPEMTALMTPRAGIVIHGGSAGSGKSSTLYALISEQARRADGRTRIIEISDYAEPMGEVMGRSLTAEGGAFARMIVGAHVPSFAEGVMRSLRRNPDIIISELRDGDALRAATQAGLSGHAVHTTAHGGSVAEILRRQMLRLERDGRPDEEAWADALEAISVVAHNTMQRGILMTRSVLEITPGIRRMILGLPFSEWGAALAPHIKVWTTGLAPHPGQDAPRNAVLTALRVHAEERGEAPPDAVPAEAEVFVSRLRDALARFPSATHSQRLEMIARAFGYRGWHAAQGRRI